MCPNALHSLRTELHPCQLIHRLMVSVSIYFILFLVVFVIAEITLTYIWWMQSVADGEHFVNANSIGPTRNDCGHSSHQVAFFLARQIDGSPDDDHLQFCDCWLTVFNNVIDELFFLCLCMFMVFYDHEPNHFVLAKHVIYRTFNIRMSLLFSVP